LKKGASLNDLSRDVPRACSDLPACGMLLERDQIE